MTLHYHIYGQGQPLIILHGLLGSCDNWHLLSNIFSTHFHVFSIDQRNHGKSPHSQVFNYDVLVEDLNEFIQSHSIESPILLGHSMGGKTVMNYAIKYPNKIHRLIVVDIAPKEYPTNYQKIFDGLKAIPTATLSSRQEGNHILKQYVPEEEMRQFLLKNLVRDADKKFVWRPHITSLEQNLDEVFKGMRYQGIFKKPSLFIKGKKSNHIVTKDKKMITTFFPKTEFCMLNTGHWVQVERPQEFIDAVFRFLQPLSPSSY